MLDIVVHENGYSLDYIVYVCKDYFKQHELIIYQHELIT